MMHHLDEMFREAREIPFSDLRGRRLFTLGTSFYELGTRKFRRLLRAAGAEVDTSAKRSTEMIVVGKNHSKGAIGDSKTFREHLVEISR